MAYIYLSDLPSGLGQAAASTVAINVPGGIGTILTVYPDMNTALAKGYGMLFIESGQFAGKLGITGPYGPLVVADANTIYPNMNAALAKGQANGGVIYTQGGTFYITGPAGPVTIMSPPTSDTAAQISQATGAVNPTAKAVLSAIASGAFQPVPTQTASSIPAATPPPPPAAPAIVYPAGGVPYTPAPPVYTTPAPYQPTTGAYPSSSYLSLERSLISRPGACGRGSGRWRRLARRSSRDRRARDRRDRPGHVVEGSVKGCRRSSVRPGPVSAIRPGASSVRSRRRSTLRSPRRRLRSPRTGATASGARQPEWPTWSWLT